VNEVGDIVLRAKKNSTPKPKQPALDFECATGEKSAQRIAQERGHAIIQSAQSWGELHAKLAAVGLHFEKKGSGAIIFVGEIAVKASSVDRAFSMGKLCKRLGEFAPGSYPQELVQIAPEPVSPINLKQWKEYRAEMGEDVLSASPVPEEAAEIKQLQEKHQWERATLHSRLGEHPRCILNIARHCLKLQQQEEMAQLRRKAKKRPRSDQRRFEDWLREHGLDYKADRWRYRKTLETLPLEFRGAPTVMATPKREPLASYAAHKQAMLKAASDAGADHLTASIEMRSEGFTREVVEDAIYHHVPEDRHDLPEQNRWRYAERITAHAFGIAGDVQFAQGSAEKKKHTYDQSNSIPTISDRMPETENRPKKASAVDHTISEYCLNRW
jgi:hypothetical protein